MVLYANRALPRLELVGGFFVAAGVIVTIMVCVIMPKVKGRPYASSEFVWLEWQNGTGCDSNGFVFCLGMLNGAFTIGTPDIITSHAEEIPR